MAVPTENWRDYINLAEASSIVGQSYYNVARKSPINIEFFLIASRHSRTAAEYYNRASKMSDDKFIQLTCLYNKHVHLSNSFRSLGFYFYYSQNQSRAIRFFERVIDQHTQAISFFPSSSPDFKGLLDDWLSKKIDSEAYIFDCRAVIAWKAKKWIEAKGFHEVAKEKWTQCKAIKHLGRTESELDSMIAACNMKIETCLVMTSGEKNELTQALKHAKLAIAEIQSALKKFPNWDLFRDELVYAVTLEGQVNESIAIYEMSSSLKNEFKEAARQIESFVTNLLAEKFENQVGIYLTDKYQYEHVHFRYKPPYLGSEIDVFAQKGSRMVSITICECKLRLGQQPINYEEVQKFCEKVSKVREYEQEKARQEGKQLVMRQMFISNTAYIEKDAFDIADKNKIEMLQANIPTNHYELVSQRWIVNGFSPIKIAK